MDRATKGEIPYGTRKLIYGLAEGGRVQENEFAKSFSEEDRKQVEELEGQVVAGEVEMTPYHHTQ